MREKYIKLTEANLNRVVNGHDKMGYVIISSSRQDIWVYNDNIYYEDPNRFGSTKVEIDSQLHTDINNIAYKKLKNKIASLGYSYIPVYGGFKEKGQQKANVEKSLIVMPFNIKSGTYTDFDKFVNDMFDIAGPNGYHQDSILIKYPDKNPQYYSCWTQKPEEGIMFTGTSLNDITKEYFTALKKWSDISKKSNFDI